jgi:hypothetical protein
MIAMITITTAATPPSWIRRLRWEACAALASSIARRSSRACSRRCLRVSSDSGSFTELIVCNFCTLRLKIA